MCYLRQCWTPTPSTQSLASHSPLAPTAPMDSAPLPSLAEPFGAFSSNQACGVHSYTTLTTSTNTITLSPPLTQHYPMSVRCALRLTPICPPSDGTCLKYTKLTMPKLVFDRAVHALQGLPICALCGASFSRWEGLEAHVTHQRCSKLLPEIPDARPAPAPESQIALPEVACPADTNEARDPDESPRGLTASAPHSPHMKVLRLLSHHLQFLHGGRPQQLALSYLREGGLSRHMRAPSLHRLPSLWWVACEPSHYQDPYETHPPMNVALATGSCAPRQIPPQKI